jgi:uncharacterized C2H2 Zn-finger protein
MRVVLDWFKIGHTNMLKSKIVEDYEGDKVLFTCAQCQHVFSREISNLILVVGKDETLHAVTSRAVCRQCKTRGDNTYRIVPKSG